MLFGRKLWSEEEAEKKGPSLVYRFQQSMESGDASDEEAPPCDPKSNNPMQKQQSKAISTVADIETEDGLKRRAIMVVAKKFSWHMQIYFTINVKIFYYFSVLLCTPVVLIYNSELGIIISSDFFAQ